MQTKHRTFKAWLYQATRSRGFLWKFALGLLALGTVVGYIASRFQPTGPWNLGSRVVALGGGSLLEPDDDDPWVDLSGDSEDAKVISTQVATALATHLEDPAVQFADLLQAIPRLAPHIRRPEHARVRAILDGRFSATEAAIAFDYLVGLGSTDEAPVQRLRTASAAEPPPTHAAYVLGRIEFKRKHYAEAAKAFLREGHRPDAWSARAYAIHALIKAREFDRFETLRHDPLYQPLIDLRVALMVAIERREWRQIVRLSPLVQLETFETRVLAITLLVGVAWSFFFWHLGEAPRLRSPLSVLCLLGFGLGALSTVPTIYAVIWQDEILKLSPRADLLHVLLYYVGGVAVREEVCKLLLFLPLLPVLIRRDDEFEALIVASLVGLGFAIEENGNYFLRSEASIVAGRFLTANFFHAALTGLNGLALFRMCTRGSAGWNDLVTILPMTIAAHGLYDAGLNLPQIDDTGFISMVIFVAFSTFYFSRVHELRHDTQTTIGLTGAFVIAVSVVAAAMIAFQMMNLGPREGAIIMSGEILGSVVLLAMFLRQFNEPLGD